MLVIEAAGEFFGLFVQFDCRVPFPTVLKNQRPVAETRL
jgi:hypothetical protein